MEEAFEEFCEFSRVCVGEWGHFLQDMHSFSKEFFTENEDVKNMDYRKEFSELMQFFDEHEPLIRHILWIRSKEKRKRYEKFLERKDQ